MNKLTLSIIFVFILYLPEGFSPRLDNLNIIQQDVIVIIDLTKPNITHFNVSNTAFTNNSFLSASILNLTFNITEARNLSVVSYVNGIKNMTVNYINNVAKNITIPFTEDGNRTILIEINDSAGNIINSTVLGVAIDSTIPSAVNASNKTTAGGKTITAETDVNISVYVSDNYLSNCTFETNGSAGNWFNITTFSGRGNTTYSTILSKANFTGGQVVGWKYHCYDIAGNYLDPINTFDVVVESQPTPSGGGGGGLQVIINATNITITELTCNKNGICNDLGQGEDFLNCPSDCKFSTKALTCDDPTIPCVFKNATVARIIIFILLPTSLVFIILPPEARRRLKKYIVGG